MPGRFQFNTVGHGSILLLAAFLFAFYPVFSQTDSAVLLFKLLYSLVIYLSLYLASKKWTTLLFAISLAIPAELIVWMPYFDNLAIAQETRLLLNLVFYALVIYILMTHILRATFINKNIIFEAILAYFFIGIFFTSIYSYIIFLDANAFSGIPQAPEGLALQEVMEFKLQYLFYYSYITVTTLGYGNIAPVSVSASAFSALEAIIGQMYIAILIARLIGIHISQSLKQSAK